MEIPVHRVILVIVASLANLFFQIGAVADDLAVAVLIFSAYILYDASNIIRGGETNYIMATLGLFLNCTIFSSAC